jgi:hypothetical protein
MDVQAKMEITEGGSSVDELPKILRKNLPHSKSAIKQVYREKLKHRAQKSWNRSPQYA